MPSTGKDLLGPTNDAAKHVSTVTFTFLVACVLVGVTVSSTSHRDLLLAGGGVFTLPVFGVGMSLKPFFLVAPVLIVLLHLHLLLLEHLLARKMTFLPADFVRDGVAAFLFPSLPANVFAGPKHDLPVRILLRLALFAANVLLPQALLLWIQIKFLPFHSVRYTRWHQLLLLADIGFVWYFYVRNTFLVGELAKRKEGFRSVGRAVLLVVWLGVSICLALFCVFVASVPVKGRGESWIARRLPLPDRYRNISVRVDCLVRDLAEEAGPRSLDSLSDEELRRYRGIRLAGRDLRNADFTNCQIPKADFRGADLEGANFTGADLRGALFSPGSDRPRFLDPPGPLKRKLASTQWTNRKALGVTNLRDTTFVGADLRGASFLLAEVSGANLHHAELGGAELLGATLRRSNLEGARLQGAELALADLTGARLPRANLTGASLAGASLIGANLDRARIRAANLSAARLQGATFAAALLDASDFRGAETIGASFLNASLKGTGSLDWDGVNLRGSRVSGLNRCEILRPPYLTDLRELILEPRLADRFPTPEGRRRVLQDEKSALAAEVKGPLQAEALARVEAGFLRTTCLVRQSSALRHRGVFYENPRGPMASWPPTQELALHRGELWGERNFYGELAGYLIERACREEHLAEGIAFTVSTRAPSLDPDLFELLETNMRKALNDPGCGQRDVMRGIIRELKQERRFDTRGASARRRTSP